MIIPFAALMVWDVLTTCLGVVSILGGVSLGSICIAILFASSIWAINFYTSIIWAGIGDDLQGIAGNSHFFIWMLRIFWCVAIPFDGYTSLQGNNQLLSSVRANSTNNMADFLIFFFTILTTASPMLVNWLLKKRKEML